MRKWMRDRLQRRKKKPEEQESQPAPPPLQPAYFDAKEPSTAEPEVADSEPSVDTSEREAVVKPVRRASPAADSAEEPGAQAAPGGSAQRGRSRRRRGGRGRGGRGREQAVAQAFTPKGVPAVTPNMAEADEPEAAEPE